MGLLVDGVWHDQWYDTKSSGGKFQRSQAKFRNWITADGHAGPSGKGGFAAESGRYHLYVSYACPWAHRTLVFRKLKGLEDHISISAVHADMLSDGWTFQTDENGATGEISGDRIVLGRGADHASWHVGSVYREQCRDGRVSSRSGHQPGA